MNKEQQYQIFEEKKNKLNFLFFITWKKTWTIAEMVVKVS